LNLERIGDASMPTLSGKPQITGLFLDTTSRRLYATRAGSNVVSVIDVRKLDRGDSGVFEYLDTNTIEMYGRGSSSSGCIHFLGECGMMVSGMDGVVSSFRTFDSGSRFLEPEISGSFRPSVLFDSSIEIDGVLIEDGLFDYRALLFSSDSAVRLQEATTLRLDIHCVSLCGDGVVSCNEECDPPVDSKNKMEYACCDKMTCRLKPDGQICKSSSGSTDCIDRQSTCNGKSSICPEAKFKEKGALCDSGSDPSCSTSECDGAGLCVVQNTNCVVNAKKKF